MAVQHRLKNLDIRDGYTGQNEFFRSLLETDRGSCEQRPISSSVHAPTMGVLVHQCTCRGVDQTTTKPLSVIIIRESEAQVALQSLVRF